MDSVNGGTDNTDMNLETTKKVIFLAGLVYIPWFIFLCHQFSFSLFDVENHIWNLRM